MPRALIDTTVLFAAAYRQDGSHDAALPVLQGIDNGTLPEAVILDYVLAETLNGLTTHARPRRSRRSPQSHRRKRPLPHRLTHHRRPRNREAPLRQHEPLSFVDACIIAYMQTEGLGYLYALDDDFDAVEDIYRLDTATNPYDPN